MCEMTFRVGDFLVVLCISCIVVFFLHSFAILVWLLVTILYFIKDPVVLTAQGIHKFLLIKQSVIFLLLERVVKSVSRMLKQYYFAERCHYNGR
jgi:hypothetical protein